MAKILNKDNYAPDLILFNGGSLKPPLVQERIRAGIRHWFNEEDRCLPRVLENSDLDLAVALGASYYGLVKIGQGVRVGSGSARCFYLGVAGAEEKDKRHAICIVERGLEEGTSIELKDKKFEVLANQPVSFDIYSSSFRSGDRCGDLVKIDDSLTSLPPIQTVIQFGKKGIKARIPVHIEADYTEMGTLALWCRSLVSNHRWRLQFQLRDAAAIIDVSDEEVFEESIVENVCSKVRNVFSDVSDRRSLEALGKDIADILRRAGVESSRDKWPLRFIRSIADEMLKLINARNLAPEYESRWLNLTGFCMRPGFGDGFDEHRIKNLWKIYKEGPTHTKNAQVRSEWWIMWRRVAGGLKPGQQRQFIQELTPVIMPKKRAKTRLSFQEGLEIWMAVANMERLLVKDKIKWGRLLLSQIEPKRCKPQHFWSLSRIGARELLYGPVDRVIPPDEVSSWIKTILSQTWHDPKPVGNALAQLARKTGDRMRDLDSSTIDRTIDWMSQYEFFIPNIKFLKDVIPMAKQEESAIFGETLPSGILLHG